DLSHTMALSDDAIARAGLSPAVPFAETPSQEPKLPAAPIEGAPWAPPATPASAAPPPFAPPSFAPAAVRSEPVSDVAHAARYFHTQPERSAQAASLPPALTLPSRKSATIPIVNRS